MVRTRVSRRQRLIDVGIELFGNRSYEEISIDDIAEAADVSKGLLYYYFPTKHDFYASVVQYATEQLLEETQPDPDLEPIERLRVSLHAYFSYVKRHAKAYVALLRGGVGVDPEVASIVDSVRQTYAQLLLQNIPGDLALTPVQTLAIRGWIGFVEAISVAWLEQRNATQEELCELAISALTMIIMQPSEHAPVTSVQGDV